MSGTVSLKILNDAENRTLDLCATCPSLCRWSCPVAEAEARETTSPHRLATLSGLLKREKIDPAQADGTPFHCSLCLACTQVCLHGNDVGLMMTLARSRLLTARVAPEDVGHISGQFAIAGNAAGRPLRERVEAAAASVGQAVVAEADEVYWPGCDVLAKAPDAAGDALRAAALAGIEIPAVTPASAGCCGLPLLWAGELDGFRAHAVRFAAQFERAKTVVAHDPACAHAVLVRYPQFGVSFRPRVTTIVERLTDAWPSAPARDAPPAYMDGCMQARGLQQIDAPRRLVEKATGQAPVEVAGLTGMSADCCGGQGLMPELVPGTAAAMAEARIDAFRASGAERVLTASPRCRNHLRSVDPSLPVEDLVAWLAGR